MTYLCLQQIEETICSFILIGGKKTPKMQNSKKSPRAPLSESLYTEIHFAPKPELQTPICIHKVSAREQGREMTIHLTHELLLS